MFITINRIAMKLHAQISVELRLVSLNASLFYLVDISVENATLLWRVTM